MIRAVEIPPVVQPQRDLGMSDLDMLFAIIGFGAITLICMGAFGFWIGLGILVAGLCLGELILAAI